MDVKAAAIAVGLAFAVALLAFHGRSSRLPWPSRLANLLFPVSQALLLGILLVGCSVYSFPPWVWAATLSAALLCFIVDWRMLDSLEKAWSQEREAVREGLLSQQLQAQEAYARALEDLGESLDAVRSDVMAALASTEEQLRKHRNAEVSRDIGVASGLLDATRKPATGIPALDALLALKESQCRHASVDFTCETDLEDEGVLEVAELCSVVANLCDNALAACRDVDEARRFIALSLRSADGMLLASAANSTPLDAKVPQGCATRRLQDRLRQWAPLWAKAPSGETMLPEHGWGTYILGEAAADHNGTVRFERLEPGVCRVTLLAFSNR